MFSVGFTPFLCSVLFRRDAAIKDLFAIQISRFKKIAVSVYTLQKKSYLQFKFPVIINKPELLVDYLNYRKVYTVYTLT